MQFPMAEIVHIQRDGWTAMEIKDFNFLIQIGLVDRAQKYNSFHVGLRYTHKKTLVKIGAVVFLKFCLHTDRQTHTHTNKQTVAIT